MHKPKVLLLENVKGFKSHDKGRTFKIVKQSLEGLGYTVFDKVLNTKDFGVPQNRERIYILGILGDTEFSFPNIPYSQTKLGDILEHEVDEAFTISDKLWDGHKRRKAAHRQKGNGFGYSLFDANSTYTSTISARYYKDGSKILIKQKNKSPRKLTPRKPARLQGFPDSFIIPVSKTQAHKQFSNSVAVPVIRAIAQEIYSQIIRKDSKEVYLRSFAPITILTQQPALFDTPDSKLQQPKVQLVPQQSQE